MTVYKLSICFLLIALTVQPVFASQPDESGMQRAIDGLEKAIKAKDETMFKEFWHSDGYQLNLVGSSGLSGKKVFEQGTSKSWFLKAHMTKLTQDGRAGMFIVPCDVWSWETEKVVDKVWVLPVWLEDQKKWVILGGGENLEQVLALSRRYLNKQPLEPPKKPPQKQIESTQD